MTLAADRHWLWNWPIGRFVITHLAGRARRTAASGLSDNSTATVSRASRGNCPVRETIVKRPVAGDSYAASYAVVRVTTPGVAAGIGTYTRNMFEQVYLELGKINIP